MLRRGGYWNSFSHRFGFVPKMAERDTNVQRIWIHAVSVGEIRSIAGLIDSLSKLPHIEIILSTTSSTAFQIAQTNYKLKTVSIHYFPIDFWLCSALAWSRNQASLVILLDSELWLEHIYQAHNRKVPVVLINARLSDKSFRWHQRFKIFSKYILNKISTITTASPQDLERYLSLGANPNATSFVGNIKLDAISSRTPHPEYKLKLLKEFGFIAPTHQPSKPLPILLMGSSTWPYEEEILLQTLSKAKEYNLNVKLLIVPRHAERKNELHTLLKSTQFNFHFRSLDKQAPFPTDVYIADTTGEQFYLAQAADIAFIGKSFPPNQGGQSPIEAACLGHPIVTGPRMTNFKDIMDSLLSASAAIQAPTSKAAIETLLDLIQHQPKRIQMSQNSLAWFARNQGATKRNIELILQLLTKNN